MHPFEAALLSAVRVGSPVLPVLSAEEWRPVAQLARREQMTPLVHAAARGGAGGGGPAEGTLPSEIATALAESYAASAAASVGRYRQLAEVCRALSAAGVPTLVLKGAALARGVYADPALRPFTDLDLLVHEADMPRAHIALAGLGYEIAGGPPTEADRTWRHGRGYFDPVRRRVPVDMHWRYAGYPLTIPLEYDAVFARAETLDIEGHPARMPAPADMVVALSISVLRELWYGKPRLRYLRDIAEVCQRGGVEWEGLAAAVAASPLLRTPLFLSVAAAAALLGAPVPPEQIAALRGGSGAFFRRRLLARVSRRVMRTDPPLAAVAEVGLMRMLDAGVVGMIRWLWTLLAVPGPLAPSQRRWLRYLTGGQFTGTRPVD